MQRDRGLRRVFEKAYRVIPAVTPSGLLIGHGPAFKIDWPRLYVLVRKWTRALFIDAYGVALPPNAEILTKPIQGQLAHARDVLHQLSEQPKHVWPGIFEYRHNHVENQPDRTMWSFIVLGTVEFIATTRVGRAPAAVPQTPAAPA